MFEPVGAWFEIDSELRRFELAKLAIPNLFMLPKHVGNSVLFLRREIYFDVFGLLRLFIFGHMAFILIDEVPIGGFDVFIIDVAFAEFAVRGLFQDETDHLAVRDV